MIFYIILITVAATVVIGGIAGLSAVMQRKIGGTTALNPDVIYSGAANHFLNGESVGGGLYLMNDKVLFKSHKLNIQNHELLLDINEVAEVHFYNTLGIIPNGLEIRTTNGKVEKFVVYKRKIWKQKIDKLGNNNI